MIPEDRFRPTDDERRFVRRLLILGGLLLVAAILWWLRNILLLVFGAVLIGILLHAIADPVARRSAIPEHWALSATVVLLFTLLGIVAFIFGSEVMAQIASLTDLVPDAWRNAEERLRSSTLGRHFLEWLGSWLGQGVSGAGTLVLSAWTWAITALAMIVGGIYFAFQPELYRRGLLALLPPGVRPAISETLSGCGRALRLWMIGQLAAMLIVGVLTGIGAWLIGLPSPLALGILAGLLEFIPYAGPVLMAIPALLLASTMGTATILLTLLLLTAVQQLEGNVITPLIQRRAVTLPPALTLFALFAIGTLFGPMGVLLAAPLTVVVYVAVKELYIRRLLGEETIVPGENPGA